MALEGCDPRAIQAAETALAVAPEHQVEPRILADCRAAKLRCESEPTAIAPRETCQLVATRGSERWEITVVPRPQTGAPTQLEVWVDEAGEEAGRVDVEGSTWGLLPGVRIVGTPGRSSHTHGGPPARIGGAAFVVDNQRGQAIELELAQTRWLESGSCELPRGERARPKPAGIALEEGRIDGAMKVQIPAGASTTVRVGHVLQDAYMVHCDRVATAATFVVDGAAVEVIAEHHVIRREPLRRP